MENLHQEPVRPAVRVQYAGKVHPAGNLFVECKDGKTIPFILQKVKYTLQDERSHGPHQ
jgi:hypothetical protein